MEHPKRRIATLLASVIDADVEIEELETWIEVPRDPSHGDHAFPCFRLSKQLKRNPAQIGGEIAAKLEAVAGEHEWLAAISPAGPYINFRLDTGVLASELVPEVVSGLFTERRSVRSGSVMIEYSQPNTHKAFHVGHTRNVALGDALVRISEWAGYDVVAANYIGDEGAHIAKCLWYYTTHFDGQAPQTNRGEFLGEMYARAVEMLDPLTLTRAPHPGVISAQVLEISDHPENDKWKVVRVETGAGERTVVCGGKGYGKGDIVAYATYTARIGGRQVGPTDKGGVTSEGLICSEAEISLSADRQQIAVLEPGTSLGQEVAELLRIPGALFEGVGVLDELQVRRDGWTGVLKAMEAREPEITALWEQTKAWSMDEFRDIYGWLDARFDVWFYESEVSEAGQRIVDELYERGVLVESEGAIGADLRQRDANLGFFILRKSDGTGLYSTKDIALAREKFETHGIERSVYVVDVSQSLHFQQVFATLELMGYERAKDCHHLAYGMVVLPDGKMSSRTGTVILFSALRERLITALEEKFLGQFRGEWSDEDVDDAGRRLAIATIKYGMLNADNAKDIVFDLDEWTAQSGNTGPYLMYQYTRTASTLEKVGRPDMERADWSALTHEKEHALLGRLIAFPDAALRAADRYEPQQLCIYLYELCRAASQFYEECSAKHAETDGLKHARLALIASTGTVIKTGLALLGIETLERM